MASLLHNLLYTAEVCLSPYQLQAQLLCSCPLTFDLNLKAKQVFFLEVLINT